jgi:hypothetical protein
MVASQRCGLHQQIVLVRLTVAASSASRSATAIGADVPLSLQAFDQACDALLKQ